MSATTGADRRASLRRASLIVLRNVRVFRSARVALVSGLVEPLAYLATLGVGIGHWVKTVNVAGIETPYLQFVGPALLVGATMNIALIEGITNLYSKLRLARVYDAILTSPVTAQEVVTGETGWVLVRALLYAVPVGATLAALGVLRSWQALALPVVVVVTAVSFGALGIAAATFIQSYHQRDLMQFVAMPLFYLSGVVFPVDIYPAVVRRMAVASPLYQCASVARAAAAGRLDAGSIVALCYVAVLGLAGAIVAARRVERTFRT